MPPLLGPAQDEHVDSRDIDCAEKPSVALTGSGSRNRAVGQPGLSAQILGPGMQSLNLSKPLTRSCSGFLSWCFMIGRTKWRAQTNDQSAAPSFDDEAIPPSTCVVLLQAMASPRTS